MKRLLLIFLMSIFVISCNSEDDCNGVVANIVNLKAQINQTNGINLFDNEDFDPSLLTIITLNGDIEELEFSIVELEGVDVIEFEYVGDIIFNYNGENKLNLNFLNVNSETDNCGILTSFNFTAKSDEQIICECDSSDIITIEFDI